MHDDSTFTHNSLVIFKYKSAKIAEDVQFIKSALTTGNPKVALGYYQDVSDFFVH